MHEARVIYSTVDFLIYQKDISLKCIQIPLLLVRSITLTFPSLSPCLLRLRLLCVARLAVIRNALIYRRSCEQTQTGQNRPSILIYLERQYTKFLLLPVPVFRPLDVRVVRRWSLPGEKYILIKFPASEYRLSKELENSEKSQRIRRYVVWLYNISFDRKNNQHYDIMENAYKLSFPKDTFLNNYKK